MSLKAKLEAIIYAAETPVTLDQLIELVKESVIGEGASDGTEVKSRVRLALEELAVDYYSPDHGVEIRQVLIVGALSFVEFLLGGVAAIGLARGQQLLGHFAMPPQPRELINRLAVPIEAEPGKAI